VVLLWGYVPEAPARDRPLTSPVPVSGPNRVYLNFILFGRRLQFKDFRFFDFRHGTGGFLPVGIAGDIDRRLVPKGEPVTLP